MTPKHMTRRRWGRTTFIWFYDNWFRLTDDLVEVLMENRQNDEFMVKFRAEAGEPTSTPETWKRLEQSNGAVEIAADGFVTFDLDTDWMTVYEARELAHFILKFTADSSPLPKYAAAPLRRRTPEEMQALKADEEKAKLDAVRMQNCSKQAYHHPNHGGCLECGWYYG